MTIDFEILNSEIILCYSPEIGIEEISNRLLNNDEVPIKQTFFVTQQSLRKSDDNYNNDSLRFCIGKVGKRYTEIDSTIIKTNNSFYFSNDIKLKRNLFIAYRNISILRKIDKIIEKDFYIGGEWESMGGISKEAFMELVNKFPKTAELNKYANSRIANIIKEYHPDCDKYENIYKQYISRNSERDKQIKKNTSKSNIEIEILQFTVAFEQLQDMLNNGEGIDEHIWQERINNILQLIYPKYILCTREIRFKGIDGYDKQPDFILVDTNGFVDILEIKKPKVCILTKQASYRNNYVPVREFAGAIQQIEKYIFCLTSIEKSQKEVLEKLSKILPIGVVPQILSPQGMLILGRSHEFDEQQNRDFELIKRQYKNITDIMTYDDLSNRIKVIIASLKRKL